MRKRAGEYGDGKMKASRRCWKREWDEVKTLRKMPAQRQEGDQGKKSVMKMLATGVREEKDDEYTSR